MASLLRSGTCDAEGFRTCSVTGLRIHRSVERYVKLFALTAVVALLVGGISAIFVAPTRWEVIGLADPPAFYKWLSIHAWNLLIFWMVFMEVAILYIGGPLVLGRPIPAPKLAGIGYTVMLIAALLINHSIATTEAPDSAPLLTSYALLPSPPLFYLGAILFILDVIVAALPFFITIWQEKQAFPNRTFPLVSFGAFITAIIALEALLGGLITYIPTFLHSFGALAWWSTSMRPGIGKCTGSLVMAASRST